MGFWWCWSSRLGQQCTRTCTSWSATCRPTLQQRDCLHSRLEEEESWVYQLRLRQRPTSHSYLVTPAAFLAGLQLQDLPWLLARLRLSQARPQLAAFKQLHESIKQLVALSAAVAALAPRAAAAAGEADVMPGVDDCAGGAGGRDSHAQEQQVCKEPFVCSLEVPQAHCDRVTVREHLFVPATAT